MPELLPQEALDAADAAVQFAQSVRRVHARRTDKGSKQREDDIRNARERLKLAMKPLRTAISRFPFGPQTGPAAQRYIEVRARSAAIQRERRKLWKMAQRPQED